MKLKRIIAIACTAAMTVSLISGCGGASDKGQKEAVKEAEKHNADAERGNLHFNGVEPLTAEEQNEQRKKICLWQNTRRRLRYIWAEK